MPDRTMRRSLIVIIGAACFISSTIAQASLGTYNVDTNAISVSGISSGACMASQVHVAYSSVVMGVGMVAGAPWYCAEGGTIRALRCMDNPSSIDPAFLASEARRKAQSGWIDSTNNLANDRVYIFQGQLDTVVVPGVGDTVRRFYNDFMPAGNIQFSNSIDAVHGFPTWDTGSACNVVDPEYINRCMYRGAFNILNHIYGGGLHVPLPQTPLLGNFYEFDQAEFFQVSLPIQSAMDRTGFVYVPSGCVEGAQCRLHVAFHGCEQGRGAIGDSFAMKAGYNEVGERNNIIILYPQAVSTAVPVNPAGCWDWWGYNNGLYARRNGNQVLAAYRMIARVANL